MKTKIRNSISGVFLIPLVVACFALLPSVQATPDPGAVGGVNNTADGSNALNSVGAGAQGNTAFGFNALTGLTSGDSNAAQGSSALASCTVGNSNTGIGNAALTALTDGDQNVAVGNTALDSITTGNRNTGVGYGVLRSGNFSDNTAVGWAALLANTSGALNTAVGSLALRNHVSGSENVAVGYQALFSLSAGSDDFNTALGSQALLNLADGDHNIAIGEQAGDNLAAGSNNIYIGAHVGVDANESNRTYIDNLDFNQPVGGAGIKVVTVNTANDRLGSAFVAFDFGIGNFDVISSRRFKDQIKPLDKGSEVIYALKPVCFRYKADKDPTRTLRAGLIAEEVEKVDPNLIVRDEEGKPERVRFDSIEAMLLNEFLKEHKKVEEQQASIAELKATVALQQKGMEVLTAQLKEQASQIQRVSAQFEAIKPAPRTVANK